MKRVISVWLPRWPIDRLRRAQARERFQSGAAHPAMIETGKPIPFALIAPDRRGPVLWAVDHAAGTAGLRRGMRLADARALCANLVTVPANPVADCRELKQLALWCNRFAPCCAVDGDDGLLLDITGCAHLFGGETALADEIVARLSNLGIEARPGLADTPGGARALARFGPQNRQPEEWIAGPGKTAAAIADMPVEALGITIEDAQLLRRLGIITIGALDSLPRAALARRFSGREGNDTVLLRLDQTLGRHAEPIVPISPPPACTERLALPEPMIDREGVSATLVRLMSRMTASLERQGLGARRLAFWCYRVDGGTAQCAVSMARATRDGDHLLRLFREVLDTINPGFGIDCAVLHAVRVESLEPVQLSLTENRCQNDNVGLLVDRLRVRFGTDAVCRLEPVDCHRPEEAERTVMAVWNPIPVSWPGTSGKPRRPFRLFDSPEPVDAVAEAPDSPPRLFAWRGTVRRVARAEGPERIEPEWWAGENERDVRDYYSVEDTEGRRYWLYRAGLNVDTCRVDPDHQEAPRWYMHGLYG